MRPFSYRKMVLNCDYVAPPPLSQVDCTWIVLTSIVECLIKTSNRTIYSPIRLVARVTYVVKVSELEFRSSN